MSNESKKVDQDAVEASSKPAEEVKKAEELTEEPQAETETATEAAEAPAEKVVEEPKAEEVVEEAQAETETATETTEAPAEEEVAEEPQAEEVVEEPQAEEVAEKPQAAAPKKSTINSKKADSPANTGDEDFNWEEFAADENENKGNLAEFEKLYSETLSTIAENEVIDGTVISMNKREVVINIGYKSEGVISISEFRYDPELKAGDKVEVYVESQEDKKGQLVLSHKKARAMRSWDRVNQSLDQDEVIKGYIKCRTKGGMIVDVFGIEAFLPGSQIDVKPIRDYDQYVDKNMEFKVVKINQEFKNIVVSHKALIEADLAEQKKEIIGQLEKGQVLEGVVKNITSYGVFVDLGGVDGLVHITDLSWSRINHPSEIVELDQKLNVVILDFDDEKTRIQLGLKQLSKHPWEALDENLKSGDKVKGRVAIIADYGAFVEVSEGVEGLIHVSEMSWSTHLRSAQDFVKVGDEVEAVILTLDREDRKMSLGIKQLQPDPWTDITTKYPVGSKHTGTVRNYTNFGVFVELEEGIDGLVYISDLSWTKKIKHPSDFVKVGDKLDVEVLELDVEGRKLNLGHKQTTENPWDKHEETYTIDSVHTGTIKEVNDKGAIVSFPDGVEAFVPGRHMSKEDGSKLAKGETAEFKVLEFNKEYRRLVVSHSAVYKAQEKRNIKAVNKSAESAEKTTLGDISDLADLKKKMESGE